MDHGSAPSSDGVPGEGGLRLALRLKSTLGQDDKLIVFSGLTHQDGSGAVASQTATALAQLGVGPVLLVDANLRAPHLQEIHSIPDTPGLLELLRGHAELDQVVYPSPAKNLTVLPTAEAEEGGTSLLTGDPMTQLFDKLRQQYRFVIIDSSPVDGSADSTLLGRIVDGMVIVAARGKRHRSELLQAKRMLKAAEARVLGVVLSEPNAS